MNMIWYRSTLFILVALGFGLLQAQQPQEQKQALGAPSQDTQGLIAQASDYLSSWWKTISQQAASAQQRLGELWQSARESTISWFSANASSLRNQANNLLDFLRENVSTTLNFIEASHETGFTISPSQLSKTSQQLELLRGQASALVAQASKLVSKAAQAIGLPLSVTVAVAASNLIPVAVASRQLSAVNAAIITAFYWASTNAYEFIKELQEQVLNGGFFDEGHINTALREAQRQLQEAESTLYTLENIDKLSQAYKTSAL